MATRKKVQTKARKAPKTHSPRAEAVHLQHTDGVHHIVGFGNIRVVIIPDGNAFFAQGLEIDHAAQGSSIEAVKASFQRSLDETIRQHLLIFGNIKGLLQVAPPEVWNDLLHDKTAIPNYYSTVTEHAVVNEALPYQGISYLVAAAGSVR